VAYFGSVVFDADRGVAVVDGPVGERRRKASAEASVAVDRRTAESHQRRGMFQQTGDPPASDVRQTVSLARVVHGVLACSLGRPERVVEVETGRRPLWIRLQQSTVMH